MSLVSLGENWPIAPDLWALKTYVSAHVESDLTVYISPDYLELRNMLPVFVRVSWRVSGETGQSPPISGR